MTKHMGNDPGKPSRAKASAGPVAHVAHGAGRGPGPDRRASKGGASGRAGATERSTGSQSVEEHAEPTEPAFERGARVRVTGGPFAGKTGVVQAMVGRRSARVLFGPLPVQIDVEDLAPSEPAAGGRGRLRLTSSHRKPVPARS